MSQWVCAMCGGYFVDRCPTCVPRIIRAAELIEDTGLYRQRILDLDVGTHVGSQVVLGFIAPSRSHFDLGYALLGGYETIESGRGNENPRLAGPWDATDSAGVSYSGLGGQYAASNNECRGIIRFVPQETGPPFRLRPAPGLLTLEAISGGTVVAKFTADVPPPAWWEPLDVPSTPSS